MLDAHAGGPVSPMRVTCFCQFCQARAQVGGIDPERARKGFLELVQRFKDCSDALTAANAHGYEGILPADSTQFV